MLEDFMTTAQAAEYLKRTTSLICKLCLKGKLLGAKRVGKRMWVIPKKSVLEYKPGLQGQAAINARKETECQKLQDDLAAQGTPISPALAAAILS